MTVSGCTAWATVADIPSPTVEMHAPAQWCVFLDTATDILWALSGRRWSGPSIAAQAVLRAAPPNPGEGAWPYHSSWGQCACYTGPGWGGGVDVLGPQWSALARGHHEPAAVRLPHDDVTLVTGVTVDGAPFTAWRLDGVWLTRTDGGGWSACHDRSAVTYLHGRPPPAGGVAACVTLAVELGRAASSSPDKACSLPQRLASITRQGVTYMALDDLSFLDNGKTGIYQADLWLASVNPKARTQAASVWSPDLIRSRRI